MYLNKYEDIKKLNLKKDKFMVLIHIFNFLIFSCTGKLNSSVPLTEKEIHNSIVENIFNNNTSRILALSKESNFNPFLKLDNKTILDHALDFNRNNRNVTLEIEPIKTAIFVVDILNDKVGNNITNTDIFNSNGIINIKFNEIFNKTNNMLEDTDIKDELTDLIGKFGSTPFLARNLSFNQETDTFSILSLALNKDLSDLISLVLTKSSEIFNLSKLDNILFQAISENKSPDTINHILEKTLDLESTDLGRILNKIKSENVQIPDNSRLLLKAIPKFKSLENIDLMIDITSNFNTTDNFGNTALMALIKTQSYKEQIVSVINNMSTVNTINQDNATALMLALEKISQEIEIIELIIQKTTKFDVISRIEDNSIISRSTALIQALTLSSIYPGYKDENGKEGIATQIIKRMIETKSSFDATKNGETALILAMRKNLYPNIVELLVDKTSKFDTKDIRNDTALTKAIDNDKYHQLLPKIINRMDSLNSPFIIEGIFTSPLLLAISRQIETEHIELLIEKTPNVDYIDNKNNALIAAINKDMNINVLKSIVNKATEFDTINSSRTALMHIITNNAREGYKGDDGLINLIINRMATVNSNSDKNIFDTLSTNKETALMVALGSIPEEIEIIKLLIENTSNFDTIDENILPNTALTAAIQNNSIPEYLGESGIIKVIIDKMVKVDANFDANPNGTALMEAISFKLDDPLIDTLIEKTKDFNALNDRNQTALTLTIYNLFSNSKEDKNDFFVKLVNAMEKNNSNAFDLVLNESTPLTLALDKNLKESHIRLLLNNTTKFDTLYNNETALMIAIKNSFNEGYISIVNEIIDKMQNGDKELFKIKNVNKTAYDMAVEQGLSNIADRLNSITNNNS